MIFVLLLLTSKLMPSVNAWLAQFSSSVTIFTGAEPSTVTIMWVNTPGVWIFIAAFVGGLIQGATPRVMGEVARRRA